jgi:hypothetical protein
MEQILDGMDKRSNIQNFACGSHDSASPVISDVWKISELTPFYVKEPKLMLIKGQAMSVSRKKTHYYSCKHVDFDVLL